MGGDRAGSAPPALPGEPPRGPQNLPELQDRVEASWCGVRLEVGTREPLGGSLAESLRAHLVPLPAPPPGVRGLGRSDFRTPR